MRYLIGWIFFILILSSCEKQNGEYINLFIDPDPYGTIKNSGEIINFNISIISSSNMSELVVIETINNSLVDTLLDIAINGTDIQEPFFYTVPSVTQEDTSKVQLLFYCKDVNGRSVQRAKVFYVISSETLLEETSGHVMYSANNSSEHDAYDLLIPESVSSSDSTAHIYDVTDSLSTVLSRRWETYTGIKFAKSNDFEYALATTQSAQSHYNSLDEKEFVDDIYPDDIIFTKIEDNVIVIKVTLVIDDSGSDNDKYMFNIKQ